MARKAITEEKQNLIRKRLLQGHNIKDIALEVGVSEITVKRYKKSTLTPMTTSLSSEDTTLQVDYTTVLSKREEKIAKKILKQIALYEDETEGWTYHLTKHDDRIRQQGLWWEFIAYPDSVPEFWLERLKNTHMQIAISPLHDKDTWSHDSPEMINIETGELIEKGARYKMGDRKKAHWHGIVKCDKKCSWREMNKQLQDILNCPYIQKCKTLRGAYDYFLHINHPERYQGYFKDEIIRLNGFVIEPTKFEQSILYDEIITTILDEKYITWTDVCKHYHGQPEYILLLSSRPAIITEILRDNWRRQYPDGRVQHITIDNIDDLKNNIDSLKKR